MAWGRQEKRGGVLKKFQSELGGRLSGSTRGSSYANQLELAYDERYGGAQAVQDALFKRHFDWKQAVPFAVVACFAFVYYTHPDEINQAGAWAEANLLLIGVAAMCAFLVLRVSKVKIRR